MRSVETRLDDTTRRMESWATAPDGTEFKSMEILYERR